MNFDKKYPDAENHPNRLYNSQLERGQDVKICYICSEYTQWLFLDKKGVYPHRPICSEECLNFHTIMRDTMK